MACLGASTKEGTIRVGGRLGTLAGRCVRLRRALILLLLAFSCMPASSSAVRPLRVNPRRISQSLTVQSLHRESHRASAHIAELTTDAPFAVPTCESIQPPEALVTSDPLLPLEPDGPFVGVSFIIGSDGRVHSAFVLFSGGADEDAAVLRAVRSWRYRPALCNGVPTDFEVRERFSIHE